MALSHCGGGRARRGSGGGAEEDERYSDDWQFLVLSVAAAG